MKHDAIIEYKEYVKTNDYTNSERNMEPIYKEVIVNKDSLVSYNYKTEQDQILNLVNALNNRSKEYDFFVYWLKECGFINEHIEKTFKELMNTTDPIIKIISDEVEGYLPEKATAKIYTKLKDLGFLGD